MDGVKSHSAETSGRQLRNTKQTRYSNTQHTFTVQHDDLSVPSRKLPSERATWGRKKVHEQNFASLNWNTSALYPFLAWNSVALPGSECNRRRISIAVQPVYMVMRRPVITYCDFHVEYLRSFSWQPWKFRLLFFWTQAVYGCDQSLTGPICCLPEGTLAGCN